MSNTGFDDALFVQALIKGQRDLRTFILGMTPTKSDADDVLQEVNLALWEKRHSYDRRQKFLRWAFGFAKVEVRSFRSRTSRKRMWLSDSALDSVAEEYPHDSQFVEQRRDALTLCIEKLGPTEHKFVTDFYGEQFSAQELAESTGRPVSSVYKILTRARQALRACVERTLALHSHPV